MKRFLFQTLCLLLGLCPIMSCSKQIHQGKEASKEVNSGNVHLRYESLPPDSFFVYQGFVVRYNKARKVPSYTLHRLSPGQLTDSLGIRAKRRDRFYQERALGPFSSTKKDYYKSGYDRGHHVPAGDFVYSQQLKDQSFVLSNVSPQHPKLNRGALAILEGKIRKKVLSCSCDAHVIIGTYFALRSDSSIGEGKVGVPDFIYKVAFFPKLDKMYAFWLDNRRPVSYKYNHEYQRSVREIENRIGFDFFSRLPDKYEQKLESSKPMLD